MIIVDANVLIDLTTDDPDWAEWSQDQLDRWAARDELAVNDVIYAELSVRFPHVAGLDAMLERVQITHSQIPREALFLAGKIFQRYRAAGGIRTGVLPDFFIGAHAAVARARLLSRDRRYYRTYFPDVLLIAPD